jgi:hypothetical protein
MDEIDEIGNESSPQEPPRIPEKAPRNPEIVPRSPEVGARRPEEAPQQPRSFLFPLLLIALGLAFLLRNTGIVSGDTWSFILRLWPVLLIAIGLDSLFRRQGIVGAFFWITLGVVLLLATLQVIPLDVWAVLLNLWPLLLVAIGLDLIIGRRSRVGAVISFFFLLIILGAALFVMLGGVWGGFASEGDSITYPLRGANSAEVVLNPGVGSLRIGPLANSDNLVEGRIFSGRGERILTSAVPDQDVEAARFSMMSEGMVKFTPVAPSSRWSWDLQINNSIPLDIEISLGAGTAELDLRELQVRRVQVEQGLGRVTVYLPNQEQAEVYIDGAMGETILVVPRGFPIQIRFDAAMAWGDIPDEYSRDGSIYRSPAYREGQAALRVEVSQAIGRLYVREE